MKREDVVIGMKVVPHSKSVGCPFNLSNAHLGMVLKDQEFLYVTHQHAGEVSKSDRFLLSDEDTRFIGDYYLCSDFEPYEEEAAE